MEQNNDSPAVPSLNNCSVCGNQMECRNSNRNSNNNEVNCQDINICKGCSDSLMSNDFFDDNVDTAAEAALIATGINKSSEKEPSTTIESSHVIDIDGTDIKITTAALIDPDGNPSVEENDEFDTILASIEYNPQGITKGISESIVPLRTDDNISNQILVNETVGERDNSGISRCIVCSARFAVTVTSTSNDICHNCQSDTVQALFDLDDSNDGIDDMSYRTPCPPVNRQTHSEFLLYSP